MNKKYLIFGLLGFCAMALVTAGVLTYYGSIQSTVEIGQAVTLGGSNPIFEGSMVAGSSLTNCEFIVKNRADVEAPIQLGTTCNNSIGFDDGIQTETSIDWTDVVGNDKCDGIETEIYGILELTTKDAKFGSSPWGENADAKATVKYTIVGSDIDAEVTNSTGITLGDYTLIYYKDNSARFDDPAQAIALDAITGSLPYATDGNLDEYDYCTGTGDNYEHCHGAKIWLVPTSAILLGNELNWARASEFLFETDLIVYSNDGNNEITLPANGGGFNFCVENEFALNLVPETYTLETKIVPVTA